jgi:hypothetical protein
VAAAPAPAPAASQAPQAVAIEIAIMVVVVMCVCVCVCDSACASEGSLSNDRGYAHQCTLSAGHAAHTRHAARVGSQFQSVRHHTHTRARTHKHPATLNRVSSCGVFCVLVNLLLGLSFGLQKLADWMLWVVVLLLCIVTP